ncbi:MAG TPA: hypothetical protein VII84_02920, partial [Acidimicrobiales bacterium]
MRYTNVRLRTPMSWATAALMATSGLVVAAGVASASSTTVKLVNTTPAAKGPLSSITWDLPGGEPT